jgi:Zn-dependent protease with chaperone function
MVDGAPLKPNQASPLYKTGLALVAIAVVILPVIYIALTGLALYGVYYFATHHFLQIWDWSIGGSKYVVLLKVVCSVTPLLVGSVIALFMVKPLFARRAARMDSLALDPAVEPRVYGLVHDVCQIVGAPMPRRIELNCELNASAGFDRGLRGFFGNGLVLTLGMPLVAGLTQRELAGVIAHEFGHFRQGAGMRLSYLIRRVNGWFARVVYERDSWDETISDWSGSEEAWVAFMVSCAGFGVWVSRGVLWLLMMFGHSITALLLRQMEYDADRAEVHVAGSAAFESTTLKLATLGSVFSEIHRDMRRAWEQQLQLPDNLPVLVRYRAERLPRERQAKIENEVGLSKTGVLDTHPSPADRVREARRLADPGLAVSDEPAHALFENFDTVSRLVTLAHYEDDLEVPTSPDFLIPLEQILSPKAEGSPAPASVPVSPVPMMAYNPAAFQGRPQTGE